MDRRQYLLTAGAAASGLLAGCGGSDTDAGDSPDVQTSSAGSAVTSAAPTAEANNQPTGTPRETAEPTPTVQPESQLRGTDEEYNQYVELQYREYYDHEVEAVRSEAETVEYDDLLRNAEDYAGDAITLDATVLQSIENNEYAALLLSMDAYGEEILYGSWTGGRYIRGDVVTVWGRVLGIETYQTGSGGQLTVPAISIADVELENTATAGQ